MSDNDPPPMLDEIERSVTRGIDGIYDYWCKADNGGILVHTGSEWFLITIMPCTIEVSER